MAKPDYLTSNTRHALKQPLTVIMAYTYFLRKLLSQDKKGQTHISKIEEEVKVITDMINEIAKKSKEKG